MSIEQITFFYENAAWGHNPATETAQQGRWRNARKLANAETWAAQAGIRYRWRPDWEIDHETEFDCYSDGGPGTCEYVVASLNGNIVASLGCVDDATDEYRRVVEAELALEWSDPDHIVELDNGRSI
jgi:hypothetical protein